MGDAGKVNPLSQHGECHGEIMNKQQIGKTDRIIIEMGQQIVGGLGGVQREVKLGAG